MSSTEEKRINQSVRSAKWRNSDKGRSYVKNYYKENTLSSLNNHLKRKYGITLEEWEALFEKQNRRCAICRTDSPTDKRGRWFTDHDHVTKIVRGILCYRCNNALGLFCDSSDLLLDAVEYLDRFR